MPTPDPRTARTRGLALLGLTLALSTTALVACSSGSTAAPASPAAATSSTGVSPTAASPEPAPVRVPLGQKVTLPSDAIEVSHVVDKAAPEARKPDTPGTHWAAFQASQCAVTDSRQGTWKLLLADGSTASEPTAWPEELPHALLPSDEVLPAGSCVAGTVYIAMPDGATAAAVVLEPRALHPTRPQVDWVVGRTSAAS
ncbi:MAG: hypothetical protein U0R68_10410 [Candidatus Nanopelagicales bacterium]